MLNLLQSPADPNGAKASGENLNSTVHSDGKPPVIPQFNSLRLSDSPAESQNDLHSSDVTQKAKQELILKEWEDYDSKIDGLNREFWQHHNKKHRLQKEIASTDSKMKCLERQMRKLYNGLNPQDASFSKKQNKIKDIENRIQIGTHLNELTKLELTKAQALWQTIKTSINADHQEYAGQAVRLTTWLLDHTHQVKMSEGTQNEIFQFIMAVRRDSKPWDKHPSDRLLYIAIFNQLIGAALKVAQQKTEGLADDTQKQQIQALHIYETAIISHLLAIKFTAEEPLWVSDYTPHIKVEFYQPMLKNFNQAEQQAIQTFKRYPSNRRNTHIILARFKALESQALQALDWHLFCNLSINDQANVMARLELCVANKPEQAPNTEHHASNSMKEKEAYHELAENTLKSLDAFFRQPSQQKPRPSAN